MRGQMVHVQLRGDLAPPPLFGDREESVQLPWGVVHHVARVVAERDQLLGNGGILVS